MAGFTLNTKGNVQYYTIDSFSDTNMVKHCFSTRKGGVSSGIYESMNLKPDCDDKLENVIENFRIICDAIDVDYKNLVFSNQVHDDKIYVVTKSDIGKGLTRKSDIIGMDALICAEPNIPITTAYADCVPLFFLDKKKRVMALAHSGWKGTVKRIGQKTVAKMQSEFGCAKENILAAIGPSIGVCHFEVGDEVAKIFINEFGESVAEKFGEKYHVNLQKSIKMQFDEIGIPKENVTCADICTYCNKDLLFSHRATNGKRGGLAAIMQLCE